MASMLLPNQGAVMLWQTFRSEAIELSLAVAQSFRRLKAHKRHPILKALPAAVDAGTIEASFKKGVLAATLPEEPAAQKPEKKVEVEAAA